MSDQAPTDSIDTEAQENEELPDQPIVARYGKYFRNMRYLFTVVIVGFGLLCVKDGYFTWPEINRQYDQLSQRIADAERDGKTEEAKALVVQRNALGARKEPMSMKRRRRKRIWMRYWIDAWLSSQNPMDFGSFIGES
jgi:hypothetical protein